MLSSIEEIKNRMKKAEHDRMKDIYSACKKNGLSERFADLMYYRMILNPLEQTETIIANIERSSSYSVKSNLDEWEKYIRIMMELYPKHEKFADWKESLKVIENNKHFESS